MIYVRMERNLSSLAHIQFNTVKIDMVEKITKSILVHSLSEAESTVTYQNMIRIRNKT